MVKLTHKLILCQIVKDTESDLNLSKLQRFKHQQSERIPLYLLATPESVQLGSKHVLLLSPRGGGDKDKRKACAWFA